MLLYARESTEVEAAVSIIFIKTTSFSSSPSLYFSFLCSNRRRRWKKCPVHVILLCILQLEHVTRFTFSPCVPPCLFCRFARSFIHQVLTSKKQQFIHVIIHSRGSVSSEKSDCWGSNTGMCLTPPHTCTHLLALFVILLCCFTDFSLCVSSLILSLSSHQINRSSAGTCAARGHCRLLGHLLLLLHRPITAAVTELHYNLLGVFQVYKHVIWDMKVSTVLYLVWM